MNIMRSRTWLTRFRHSAGKIATFMALLFGLSSCIAGMRLNTGAAAPSAIEGTYRVFLYGCRSADDIENAAILAKEGAPYRFELFAPSFEYQVKGGLSAQEALKEADRFLQCSFFYQKSRLRSIVDPAGAVIGYELRPLYSPIRFGEDDVLDISYVLNEGTVRVFIQLKPEIDRFIHSQGRGGDDRDSR